MSKTLAYLRNSIVFCVIVFFNTNLAWALDDLSNAVLTKDNIKLQALIANGAEVKGDEGGKALWKAALYGKYAAVETLVVHGANVNFQEPTNKFTPLHEVVSYLTNKPWSPSKCDVRPPLDVALAKNKTMIAELLIARGADVNAKNKYGITPLYLVATKEMAELLIKHGADINAQTIGNSDSILLSAIANNREFFGDNIELIDTLIANGANVNYINYDGYTPLHFAVRDSQKALVTLLIKHSAVGLNKDRDGFTPLNIAVRNNNVELADMLISKDEQHFNAQSGDGLTNLHSAAINGNKVIVKLLIARDAQIRDTNQYGLPQMVMSTALARVRQINTLDKYGRTPLDIVIKNNNKELIELITKHGGSIGSKYFVPNETPQAIQYAGTRICLPSSNSSRPEPGMPYTKEQIN